MAGVNQLLRSGPIEQFADTPIFTRDGVRFSAGSAGEHLFHDAERLTNALQAAQQAGGVVAPGWETQTSFEEWSDRLVLKKTIRFEMIDGARFNTEFFGGAAFQPSENLVSEPGAAPTTQEVLDMAAAYIARGEHHALYPAAAAAGELSAQDLMDEIGKDRGPVTLTETIEFTRIVQADSDLNGIQPGRLSTLAQEAVPGAVFTDAAGSVDSGLSFPGRFGGLEDGRAPTSDGTSGRSTYRVKMLNGFTIGNEWSKSVEYDRTWFWAKATAFAEFGLGVRIPWEAEVEVSPSRITAEAPDRTPYEASLRIDTVNANEDFYREVGLPSSERFDGQELVVRAGAGIAFKLKVLGAWVINRGTDNPLIGRTVDLGKNFEPPLGSNLTLATADLPYETSGLGWRNWAVGIGADFRAQLDIRGERFDLDVSSKNSWKVSHLVSPPLYGTGSRTLRVEAQNTPVALDFAIRDDSPTETSARGIESYRFGPIYRDATYHTDLDITPQARLRGTIYLSNVWSRLSNINLTSNWWSLFTASFDLPELGPHRGTDSEIDATTRNIRLLGARPTGSVFRELASETEGVWGIRFSSRGNAGGIVTEFIPEGFELVPGSITGGGAYDAASRSIVWVANPGESLHGIGYRLTGEGAPAATGQWQGTGSNEIQAIPGGSAGSQNEADLALRVHELSQRPTLEEVQDARPGSVLLRADGQGKVHLSFELETSEDLVHWTPTKETAENPIRVEHPMEGPKRYFRFRMGN